MSSAVLVALLSALGLLAVSGLAAPFCTRRGGARARVPLALAAAGAALGLAATLLGLAVGARAELAGPSLTTGALRLGVDALGLLFLVPVFLVGGLGALYGEGYWRPSERGAAATRVQLFWGVLVGALGLIVLSRDGVLFLVAWEVMALAAFFLITSEDEELEVRRAGWIYLAATHVGTLCLIGFFGLLAREAGTTDLSTIAAIEPGPRTSAALFLLLLAGFGLKAGIVPLHVWLPGAHASAPSHVSALLSGVVIKMGLYGLARFTGVLPHPPLWWAGVLLALGSASALLGIVYALAQSDLKRVLAYSTIENAGIALMGIALALAGRALSRPDWIALGLGGALFHVLNHALFKPALFFGAGAVVHATHTRAIDQHGGLLRAMPRAGTLFLIACVAICGLPPLNGFVGELLLYLGFVRTFATPHAAGAAAATWGWAALGAPALALVGALSLACFVRLAGVVFLGEPRGARAERSAEPPAAMLAPMALLVLACVALGVAPALVLRWLDAAVAVWAVAGARPEPLATLVPAWSIGALALAVLAALALLALVARALGVGRSGGSVGTWDCGYARPGARMQYTGSSFSGMLALLFGWALFARRERPRIRTLFPAPERFGEDVPDLVLERALLPAFRVAARSLQWLRRVQQGRVQLYLLYVLLALLALWMAG